MFKNLIRKPMNFYVNYEQLNTTTVVFSLLGFHSLVLTRVNLPGDENIARVSCWVTDNEFGKIWQLLKKYGVKKPERVRGNNNPSFFYFRKNYIPYNDTETIYRLEVLIMFGKKTYTLRFNEQNLETIKAIMDIVGIKGKKYYSSDSWNFVVLKEKKEKLMELSNKLDKYNLPKEVIFI